MKIAYGTYGMPGLELEEALPAIAEVGYDGVELATGDKYPTAPDQMSAAQRRDAKELLASLHLELPALMMLMDVMAAEARVHEANLALLRSVAELANDLALGAPPVISTTLGGSSPQWEAQRDELVQRLSDYADVVAAAGCVLAAEPHVNGLVDRPERAVWLMQTLDCPAIRLNFDISHFHLIGLSLEDTVPVLVPYSVHTHVKDSRKRPDGFEFLLPGQGDFDYVEYLKAMQAAGWEGHITVEVSAMIWSREGYDPFAAAKSSYEALRDAFEKAGIPRQV